MFDIQQIAMPVHFSAMPLHIRRGPAPIAACVFQRMQDPRGWHQHFMLLQPKRSSA
jgi:hypothetical protein